jgi:Tfp pilus assembly protein PilO
VFGSKKNKSNSSLDETLKDNSKKIVIGVSVLVATIIIVLILEIYTVTVKGSQNKKIRIGKGAEERSKTIMLEMAKIGKETKDLEFKYYKALETIMSPMEFQNFKNSISGIANKNKVKINSINEGKVQDVRGYKMNTINLDLLSGYNDYVNFKKNIAETPFRINFDKETIIRENPTSSKIKITAVISALVFEKKDKLLKDNKKFIEQMKRVEERKIAKEKRLKELKEQKKN